MLAELAREAAHRFGDRTAYVASDGWSVTYEELDRVSDEVAGSLRDRGVGEGDVVAIALPAVPEHVVAYLAAARIGAVSAAVNTRLAPPERAAVLDVAAPAVTVATPELAADIPATCAAGEVVEVVPAGSAEEMLDGLRARGSTPDPLTSDPDRPIAIVFTSGTTGPPRGAVFGGRQLEFITAVDTGHRWGEGGSGLAGTSLAHLAHMTKLPGKLVGGGVTYLMDRWRASDALRLIAEHRLSRLGGIPTQVALMLRDPDFDRYDLSCVKVVVIGGGPATPALVREARQRLGCPVLVRYSCTEAGVGTGTTLDDPPEDSEISVGRPLPGVELRIDPDNGAGAGTGDGAGDGNGIGEVCLRSPAVMQRYHRDPDATAAALTDDGFVRTGDLGRIDEAGRLRLVGRSKEIYVRGGYNVAPVAVESVLAQHPGVADVAVIPRPDEVMGEVGVAVVVPHDHASPPELADLRSFAGGHLARHELPEHLVVVDSLPLTPMDKVDRRALTALVQTSDTPSGD